MRQQLRAQRAAIPKSVRRAAAVKAARSASRLLRNRRHVAVYFSHGSELDTGPLIQALARRNHRLYLPRLQGGRMSFVPFSPGAKLRRNRFGIPEPVAAARAARLDAIVLPLVGFGGAGRRLGQGGGFYDRALARRRSFRIGFAFAAQEAAEIPAGEL
ncbi:MAG: 5-formyltetrahydrofolate cyclo-ligase, partial [Hydrocarboniphaga effusa]|nr:5-formyltetrahydrofolate cyclo-ligase [Hydrocarboniphaga effusa]